MSGPPNPYVPRNGASPDPAGPSSGNSRIAAIQQQINQIPVIMRQNIIRVAGRGQIPVNQLQITANNLAVAAQAFRRVPNYGAVNHMGVRPPLKSRWKNMMRINIGVAIAVIIVIIVVSIVKATGK